MGRVAIASLFARHRGRYEQVLAKVVIWVALVSVLAIVETPPEVKE